jgi:hypothetical protein
MPYAPEGATGEREKKKENLLVLNLIKILNTKFWINKHVISARRVKGQNTPIQRQMAHQIERSRTVLDFRARQESYEGFYM